MKIHPTLDNQPPAGTMCHDVTTSDGVHLRAVVARQTKSRGTLFVLNGRADFSERYFEFTKEMQARGFATVSFDWRGQGGSQRLLRDELRGFVKSFADFDKDLEAIIALAKRLDMPEPYYAFAHSTGGQILLRALRSKTWFKRAVITSPLMGFHYGRWPMPVVHLLNFLAFVTRLHWLYLPGFARGPMKRSEFSDNPLTSDRGRWNRDITTIETFPEISLGGPTFSWLRAAMKSFADLRNWPRGRGPSCPTMIVMAGQDKVVNNVDCRRFVEQVPGFTVLTIADSRHEILMENNGIREKFLAAFDSFMGIDTIVQR
jgi:lysophospholipase